MSGPSWLQRTYWSHFSKPVQERSLYKTLLQHPVSSILEIGVGDGARLRRIAKVASLTTNLGDLRYIGTDEFESAADSKKHLSLKQAHQLTAGLGFGRSSLIPGDVASAMPRVAHKFGPSDLIIVSSGFDFAAPQSGPIGSWLNRLAHDGTIVLAAADSDAAFCAVDIGSLDLADRLAA